jgi:hypothetical protein
MSTRSRTLTATLAAVVTAVLAGCVPATAHATTTHTTANEARAELSELDVADPDTTAAYRRADWGPWTHHDGCTTRSVVLARDAVPGTLVLGPGCRVIGGEWISPYDQHLITDPAGVQIDHRVPVAEAAMTGGADWSRAERSRFYNDPGNLVAVTGQANDAKGDQDPGTWRPANRADWCAYAADYIATKDIYRLTVDATERAALAQMLDTCPTARSDR